MILTHCSRTNDEEKKDDSIGNRTIGNDIMKDQQPCFSMMALNDESCKSSVALGRFSGQYWNSMDIIEATWCRSIGSALGRKCAILEAISRSGLAV